MFSRRSVVSKKSKNFFKSLCFKMSAENSEDDILLQVKKIVPSLSTHNKHKGQDGRIGVFGGSQEYCGAPYFAGMTALRVGADLVHIFCAKEASIPIKSYSPELIVHPMLDQDNAIDQIKPWLDRLHTVLIGPGLGRDKKVFSNISQLIQFCRSISKPMVIDADGLFLITQQPDLVRNYPGLILTPNAIEFTRLVKAFLNESVEPSSIHSEENVIRLAKAIGDKVVIVQKGESDIIANGEPGSAVYCKVSGSGRRAGGQGDLLAGSLSVLWWWAIKIECNKLNLPAAIVAAYGACRLVRECNAAAFEANKRGMLATDMISKVPAVFNKFFEIK